MTDKPYSSNQNEQLISWIQSLNLSSKQKKAPLQEQLQFVTQKYKNAQDQLLSLQKQLYYESLYNQKQRSIIEILKHLIQQNLDDETILTYIMNLQEQHLNTSAEKQVEKRYEIKSQLEQIKNIIHLRKNRLIKSENNKDGVINDLKKELKKMNQIKRQLMQDLERVINEKQDLQEKLAVYIKSSQDITEIHKETNIKIAQLNRAINELKDKNIREQQKTKQLTENLQLKNKIEQKIKMKITKFINKYIEEQLSNQSETQLSLQNIVQYLCKKVNRYRLTSIELRKKIAHQHKTNQLLSVCRMFIPLEVHDLVDQYLKQEHEKEYLLKQLENIANLNKKKIAQMQVCQQQMWSMKVRLLRQRQQKSYSKRKELSPYLYNKQNLQPNSNNTKISQIQKTSAFQA